jgi:hypothetical protein
MNEVLVRACGNNSEFVFQNAAEPALHRGLSPVPSLARAMAGITDAG